MPSHGHGATVTTVANHNHTLAVINSDGYGANAARSAVSSGGVTGTISSYAAGSHTHGITVSNTGEGGSHNNLQPYIVVNYWVRMA